MKNFLFIAMLLFCSSFSFAAAEEPEYWFEGIVRNHCRPQNTAVKCIGYKDGDKRATFTYAGDGHQQKFQLTWPAYKKLAHFMDGVKSVSMSREDYLDEKKKRLRFAQAMCQGSLAGCGIALTAMPLIYPGLVLIVACTTATTYCMLRTSDEVDKINKELDEIREKKKAGEVPSTGSVAPPAPVIIPTLPPPPRGTVTIIDHPGTGSSSSRPTGMHIN